MTYEDILKKKVVNKYNLTLSKIRKMKIKARHKIGEPLFWRNDSVKGWCITGDTSKLGANYNDFWLCIYDEGASIGTEIEIIFTSEAGTLKYDFDEFFLPEAIDNEHDLLVQEILLEKINDLIDVGILEEEEND